MTRLQCLKEFPVDDIPPEVPDFVDEYLDDLVALLVMDREHAQRAQKEAAKRRRRP